MFTKDTDRNFTLADLQGMTIDRATVNDNGVIVLTFRGNDIAVIVNAERFYVQKRNTQNEGLTTEWEGNYVREAVEGGHI